MAKVTFIRKSGESITVDVTPGLSVMEAAQKFGISEIEGSCGGSLACATCHVYVRPDWWDKCLPESGELLEEEEYMLDLAFDLRNYSRLCCQIIMRDELDGLVVALPGTDIDW